MARPVWGFPGLWHLTQEASGPLVIDYHWLFHQNKPKNSIGIPRFWILFNHHFCCWKIMLNHLKSNLFVANPHKQSDDNWKLNPRANSQPLVRWFFFGQAASLWMPAFKQGGKVCCVNNRPGDVRLVVFSHFSPIFLYILSRWWLQHIPILRNLTFGQVKKGGVLSWATNEGMSRAINISGSTKVAAWNAAFQLDFHRGLQLRLEFSDQWHARWSLIHINPPRWSPATFLTNISFWMISH